VRERIPYLILPVTQLSYKPFGSRRTDTRKPSGSGRASAEQPPMICRASCRRGITEEPFAEVSRVSHWAIRRASLDPNHPPKRRERAVRQYAGPVSKRTIYRSDTRKPSGSHRAYAEQPPTICRASRRRGTTDKPSCKPLGGRRASASTERSVERSVERDVAAELQRSNRTP